jgi:hypothetical protein
MYNDIRLFDVVYLKSGSPKLIVKGLRDEEVLLINTVDNHEFSTDIRCLSYENNKAWLDLYPKFKDQ